MSSNITLTAGVRQNLLSLQQTADLMSQTQNRLATGKKVNSALDNPLNFFTSSSLSARASDLSNLLDSMAGGIQTIQAGNNGITAITSLVQQLQSTVSQARSDTTSAAITPGAYTTTGGNTSTQTNNKLKFDLGSGVTVSVDTYTHVNATVSTLTGSGSDLTQDDTGKTLTINDGTTGAVSIDTSGGAVAFDGSETAQNVADQINTDLLAAGSTVQATVVGGQVKLTNSTGKTITVAGTAAADLGFATGNTTSTDGSVEVNTAKTIDELVDEVNNSSVLSGKVRASNVSNQLKLENLTNTAFTLTGASATAITGATANTTTLAAGTGAPLSSVRQSLLNQFNNLLTQIDQAAADSGYNGINLLNSDKLTIKFNETGTSSIDVQATDSSGAAFAITSANLGIAAQTTSDFASNSTLDTLAGTITTALTTLRTQASSLGSQLSVVQTRQDFTKNMINTLQTGSDNLVLADTNEESANLLALQTRQQLSITALSLSAQANQAVLRLFG
jgi:flagellin-like hook-associated protein FlgL